MNAPFNFKETVRVKPEQMTIRKTILILGSILLLQAMLFAGAIFIGII